MLSLFTLLSAVPAASAATLEVCASCDYTSIQAAIDDSVDGDEVVLMGGTFNEAVVVDKSITLRGDWATSSVIDAYGLAVHRTVSVTGADVVLRNIEITNTGVSDDGCEVDKDFARAAVQINGDSHLSMQQVSITDGCPYYAPVYNFGILSVTNGSEISGNEAYYAGAIYNRGILHTWKTSSDHSILIEDNTANLSGGVYFNDYTSDIQGYSPGTNLRDVWFSNNLSAFNGGAVTVTDYDLLLQDCVFEDNQAFFYRGGGWYFSSTAGSVTRSGNTYSGNSAGVSGTDNYYDANTGDMD